MILTGAVLCAVVAALFLLGSFYATGIASAIATFTVFTSVYAAVILARIYRGWKV